MDWADEQAQKIYRQADSGAGDEGVQEWQIADLIAAALREAYKRGYDKADAECEAAHGEF